MSEQENPDSVWHCPHCNQDVTGFHALSRRNVGYAENAKICSNCGELEAMVDMADDITPMIHWEFSFHQLCCGNATQDGHEEFHKFLAFRKKIGKHDPSLSEIEWMIFSKMFSTANRKVWLEKSKPRYDKIEASWNNKSYKHHIQ